MKQLIKAAFVYFSIIKKDKMKRFKVIKRKFKIDNVNELSKGCRVSRIISCVVENLDSGELLKIKSKDCFGLEEKIINRVDEMDCEVGDIVIIKE